MNEIIIKNFQVQWDGFKVWVNGPDGSSRARYDSRSNAMDIHHNVEIQMETGKQCDLCGKGTWEDFVRGVSERIGIDLPDSVRPTNRKR